MNTTVTVTLLICLTVVAICLLNRPRKGGKNDRKD